jgi:TolB-like protein/predicted Zn-dependent protease
MAVQDSTAAAATSGLRAAAVLVAAQPIPAKSIAVLPFENISTDKGNAYFADGMQDLILTKLADISDLKVISRTSTLQYGSHPGNLKQIGEQLGAAAILEGSVQKAGNQVLVNVQLIDARSDGHIWAQSYQRTLDNIFGVEGEVAGEVADALKAKLTATESNEVARVPTTNPDAYMLYLKGVYEIDQFFTGDGDERHVKQAEAYLQQAVAKDPDFALAYALLARTQGDLQFNDIEDSPALARGELANARRAVALDPHLAEAHDDLAVAYGANQMFDKVIPELETSLRLAPNDERTRYHLASEYMDRDEWDKAKVLMAPLIRMNPTNALAYLRVAEMEMALGQYARAQSTLDQGMAVAPKSVGLASDQAQLFLLVGEPDKALQWSSKLPTADGTRQEIAFAAYMMLGKYAEALSAAQSIPDAESGLEVADKQLAVAQASGAAGSLREKQEALQKARSAIQPYFHLKPVGAIMASSHRIRAYELLAEIEMRSGRRESAMQAVREARAAAVSPLYARSAQARFLLSSARIAAHFGDAGTAVKELRQLLLTQGTGQQISVGLLKFDQDWASIRNDPRFQTLLKEDSSPESAPASGAAPDSAANGAGIG